MWALELPILAIVVAWIVLGWPAEHERRATAQRLAALAVAGWVAEQSMIRAHGYYFYPPGLSLQIGHVPLVVVLAWPVVLDASFTVARRVTNDPWTRVLATAALVGVLASVWQPLAVHLQLVRWNASGPLGVPPVAMLGTAIFGGATARLLLDTDAESPIGALADVLAAVGATHVGVLACWHAGLWRLEHPVEPSTVLLAAAIIGIGASVIVLRRPIVLPRRVVAVAALALALLFVVAIVGRVPLGLISFIAVVLAPVHTLAIGHAIASRRRR